MRGEKNEFLKKGKMKSLLLITKEISNQGSSVIIDSHRLHVRHLCSGGFAVLVAAIVVSGEHVLFMCD